MSNCKFTWYNLPNKIKNKIEPYKNFLSKEAKNIYYFNLPNKLNILYRELSEIKPECAIDYVKFIWFNLPNKVKALCELVDCEETVEYNFDIEATDWANGGITDEESFIAELEDQGATNVVVTDFSLVDGRLQCNLSFDGTTALYFNSLGITKINNVNVLVNLSTLDLNNNNISAMENLDNLVNLTNLDLQNNNFTTADYTTAEAWATIQPPFTNPCVIYFYGNPDSPIGTNFEAILLTKNVTLTY